MSSWHSCQYSCSIHDCVVPTALCTHVLFTGCNCTVVLLSAMASVHSLYSIRISPGKTTHHTLKQTQKAQIPQLNKFLSWVFHGCSVFVSSYCMAVIAATRADGGLVLWRGTIYVLCMWPLTLVRGSPCYIWMSHLNFVENPIVLCSWSPWIFHRNPL